MGHSENNARGIGITLLLLILTASCDYGPGIPEDNDPYTPQIEILSPTMVSETGFQVNWSIVQAGGFNSIAIELSEDSDLDRIIKYVETSDPGSESLSLSGLKGATRYYYRISLLENSIPVFSSSIASVETSYRTDHIQIVTEDDLTLSSHLSYLESLPGSRPGIILMHEFGVWVNPWIDSELVKRLVADGYICLTFYFRGHGTSTPVEDLMDLINDKTLVTRDLKAAINYMEEEQMVDPGALGLVGGSMGASMALAGNGFEEVLTSVALSPSSDGVFLIFPEMTLRSVYYLVGELDIMEEPAIDCPAEAQMLYELTAEPRKLDIIPGTSDHGSNLLSRDSLNLSIENWILESLPLQ